MPRRHIIYLRNPITGSNFRVIGAGVNPFIHHGCVQHMISVRVYTKSGAGTGNTKGGISHIIKPAKPDPIYITTSWNVWDCKKFNLETTGKP